MEKNMKMAFQLGIAAFIVTLIPAIYDITVVLGTPIAFFAIAGYCRIGFIAFSNMAMMLEMVAIIIMSVGFFKMSKTAGYGFLLAMFIIFLVEFWGQGLVSILMYS